MARWWCALWVPVRGTDESVAPVAGGMFPDGVMGWWIKGRRLWRVVIQDGDQRVEQEQHHRLVEAIVEAPDHRAAEELLGATWRPAEINRIESRRPDWWPNPGPYPLAGRSPARWKLRKAVAGG